MRNQYGLRSRIGLGGAERAAGASKMTLAYVHYVGTGAEANKHSIEPSWAPIRPKGRGRGQAENRREIGNGKAEKRGREGLGQDR